MKQLYTKRIVRSVLSKIDEDTSITAATLSKTVPVLNAIQWVSSAIKEIKGETVRKCFAMCGLGEHSQDTRVLGCRCFNCSTCRTLQNRTEKGNNRECDDPRGVYAGR